MAIGTHFIVYERAVGAGPRDGGAAIGKWRDEEAGHNTIAWCQVGASGGTTVIPSHLCFSLAAANRHSKCCYLTRTTYCVIFRKNFDRYISSLDIFIRYIDRVN